MANLLINSMVPNLPWKFKSY